MDFSFLSTYYPYFISGVLITIVISIITVIFGTILGVTFALMKLSKVGPLRWIANTYIEVLRGTPMLVQISDCIWFITRAIFITNSFFWCVES
jgi:polar amino acid transport system permease protein